MVCRISEAVREGEERDRMESNQSQTLKVNNDDGITMAVCT